MVTPVPAPLTVEGSVQDTDRGASGVAVGAGVEVEAAAIADAAVVAVGVSVPGAVEGWPVAAEQAASINTVRTAPTFARTECPRAPLGREARPKPGNRRAAEAARGIGALPERPVSKLRPSRQSAASRIRSAICCWTTICRTSNTPSRR